MVKLNACDQFFLIFSSSVFSYVTLRINELLNGRMVGLRTTGQEFNRITDWTKPANHM